MTMRDEVKRLQDSAVVIATIKDRSKRHKGGMWLNHECQKFESEFRPLDGIQTAEKDEVEIEFRAVIQILLDHILYDALEDDDWASTIPDSDFEDIEAILRGK